MESLSKEKNLILGLLLGMAIAIAIPYAQPSELRASEEVVTVTKDRFDDVIEELTDEMEDVSDDMIERVLYCIDGSALSGAMGGAFGDTGEINLRLTTYCDS